MGEENLQGKVGLDIAAFKAGVAALNREIKVINTGFDAAAASMDDWSQTSDGLQKRLDSLTKVEEAQQKKVDALRAIYERLKIEKGENSREAQNHEIWLNRETAALNSTQREIEQTTAKLNAMNDGLEDLNLEIEVSESKYEAATAGMKNWERSSDGLKAKLTSLSEVQNAQRQRVEILGKQYEEMCAAKGENAEASQRLLVALNKETAALKETQKEITETTSKLNNLSAIKLKEVGQKMADFGRNMSTYVTLPLLAAGGAAVKLGSDVAETMDKTDEVFKDSSEAVKEWSESTIDSIGLAQGSALDMASTFGDMGTSMGQTTVAAARMSMSVVELAGDLVSLKNIKMEQAETALRGIYTGEGEALKSLGIIMQDSTLKAFAMAKGTKKSYEEMTQAEKVALRFEFVMDAAKNSQGNFGKTIESTANQTRLLNENIKELGADVGQELIPVITPLIKQTVELVKGFRELDDGQKKTILTIAGIVAAIGPAVLAIGSMTTAVGSAISTYNMLSSAVASAGGMMAVLTGPAGLIALTVAGVVALAAGVVILTQNTGLASKEAQKLADACKESAKAFDDQRAKTVTEASVARGLAAELSSLAGKEKLSNDEKIRMTSLVSQLNKLMPDLNLQINEQTGKLNMQAEALSDIIELKYKEIALSANEDRLTTLYKERADIMDKLKKGQDDLKKAADEYIDVQSKGSWAIQSASIAMSDAQHAAETYKTALNENSDAVKAAEQAYKDMADEIWLANEQRKQSEKDVTEVQQDEYSMQEINGKEALEQKRQNALAMAAVNEEYLQKQKEYQEKLQQATEEHMSQMGDLDAKGIQKSKLTAAQVKKNLEKQIKDFQDWQAAIHKLSSRVPEDVMADLQALGPGSSRIITDLNKMTDKDLEAWVTVWQKKGTVAKEAAEDELSGLPGSAKGTGKDTTDSLAEGIGTKAEQKQVKDAATSLATTATGAISGLPSSFKNIGTNAGNSLAAGIKSATAAVRKAAEDLAATAKKAMDIELDIHSPSRETNWRGRMVGVGLVEGIIGMIPQVRQSSADMSRAALTGLSNLSIAPHLSLAGMSIAGSQAGAAGGSTPVSITREIATDTTRGPIVLQVYGNIGSRADVDYLMKQAEVKLTGRRRAKGG